MSYTSPNSSSGLKSTDEEKLKRLETFKIIKEMSDILNTGLDSEALGCCIKLCEDNVDATALAQVLKDWRTRRADQDDLNLNKE